MTCAEFRELAALYVLGSLSPEETAEAETHLQQPSHEGCIEAIRGASAGAEVLALSLVPVKPPEAVWRAIEGRTILGRRGMPWRERIAWLTAAAAVLLVGAAFLARGQLMRDNGRLAAASAEVNGLRDQCLRDLSASRAGADQLRAVVALIQSPSAQVIAMAPQPGQQAFPARAVVDLSQRKAVVLSGSVPKQEGKDFQLWVLRGGTPEPAGLLRADASGTLLASVDPALLATSFDAFAVSVEPVGGSPTGKPTGNVVLVGALSKT